VALDAAELGTWEFLPETLDVHVDDNCRKLFGFQPGEAFASTDLTERIHPEDRSSVDDAIKKSIAGDDHRLWGMQYRVVWPDGSIHWLTSHGRAYFSGDGDSRRAARLIGVNMDITERKRAEEALRDSQAKLQGIVNSAMDAVISVNEQQRIVVFNQAAETIFRCTASESLGTTLDRFIPEALRAAHGEHIRRFGREGITSRSMTSPAILTAVRSNGEEFPIEATLSHVQAAGERILTVILRDITERIKVEHALQKSMKQLQIFVEHAPVALAMFDSKMQYLCASRRWLEDYGLGDRDPLGQSHYDVFPEIPERWKEAHRRGLAGEVLHEEADRFYRADGTLQWLTWKVVPWHDASGCVGGIVVFTEDITDRLVAEQKLHENEKRFQTLANSIPQLCWMANPDGFIFWYNERWYEFTGTTPEQMEGWGWQSVLDPEALPTVLEQWKNSIAARAPFEMTFPLRGADGVFRSFLTRVMPVLDADGKVVRWFGTNTDINERKRAEEELRASEMLYRSLFNSMDEGFCVIEVLFDPEGKPADYRFLGVNAAFEKQTGMHDAVGKRMREIAPSHEEYWFEIYGRIALTGEPEHFQNEAKALNRFYEVRAYRVGEPEQRQVAIVFSDITERKRAGEAELRLVAIVTSSQEAIIGKTLDGIITSWNPAAEKLFGYTAEEAIGNPMLLLFPAGSEEEELGILASIRHGERMEQFEAVRIRKDGKRLNVSVVISSVTNNEGKIIGASQIARDITEQKRAEQELKASEIRYRRLFESAKDGILILNAETAQILDVNPFLVEMLGYSHTEFLGRKLWEVGSFKDIEECQSAFHELQKHETIRYEDLPLETADGRRINVEFISSVYFVDSRKLIQCSIRDITARRRADEKVREGEQRFQTMANSIPQLAWIARPDGFIFWYNQRWYDYTGTKPEEMEGWGWQTVHDPQVLPRVMEEWTDAIAAKKAFEMEFPLRGADGRFRRFLNRAMPLKNAEGHVVQWFGTNTDITAQKQIEDALRESEERFSKAFRSSPVGTIIVRVSDNRFVELNDTFVAMTGYAREELLGSTTTEHGIMQPEEALTYQALLHSDGKNTGLETTLKTKSGEIRNLLSSVEEIMLHGEPHHLGCVVDITERRRAEEALREVHRTLEQRVVERTSQLEAANKELEAFSYSVSHDLRAPLRAVNGFAGIVLEDFSSQLPEEGKKYLERIRKGGEQMGCLIDDLLALSHLSRQPMNRRKVDMVRLVRTVLEELNPQFGGREVEIKVGNLPSCHGDAALLKQVWMNLLSNAIKYSRGRKKTVVEIGCMSEKGENVYIVRDNGAGFDMTYAHKLFGVFQRLHRSDEFEGTGVGLAIVQRVVYRHGGRVWAEAEVDRGATFYFTVAGEDQIS
jgi:PAS domain S-box-containing protein